MEMIKKVIWNSDSSPYETPSYLHATLSPDDLVKIKKAIGFISELGTQTEITINVNIRMLDEDQKPFDAWRAGHTCVCIKDGENPYGYLRAESKYDSSIITESYTFTIEDIL
jgi:hypothetical protein